MMIPGMWYRNTRGVTGFVGPGSKPVPLSDEEMETSDSEDTESLWILRLEIPSW